MNDVTTEFLQRPPENEARARRPGEPQTLMLSRKREIECHYGDPGNVVGDYPG